MRSVAGRKEASLERWWCGPCAGILELRVNLPTKLETIQLVVARAAVIQLQVVVATLHLPTLVTRQIPVVAVGTLHPQITSRQLEFTQPYLRVGLQVLVAQEPHPWWATQDLDIQSRELLASLGWFIQLSLLLLLQPYPIQCNQVQEWSTKVSNHLLVLTWGKAILLDPTRDRAILEGRTARV